jgi:hypothetical protein
VARDWDWLKCAESSGSTRAASTSGRRTAERFVNGSGCCSRCSERDLAKVTAGIRRAGHRPLGGGRGKLRLGTSWNRLAIVACGAEPSRDPATCPDHGDAAAGRRLSNCWPQRRGLSCVPFRGAERVPGMMSASSAQAAMPCAERGLSRPLAASGPSGAVTVNGCGRLRPGCQRSLCTINIESGSTLGGRRRMQPPGGWRVYGWRQFGI